MHTSGVHVIGSRSESDSKDSYSRDDRARWRVCIGCPRHGAWNILELGDKRHKPIDYGKVEVERRSRGCKLRMLVTPNLRSATPHLLHAVAFAVHGAAAGALFLAHHAICHAGQQRRCGQEQDENREDTGQTAHAVISICLNVTNR